MVAVSYTSECLCGRSIVTPPAVASHRFSIYRDMSRGHRYRNVCYRAIVHGQGLARDIHELPDSCDTTIKWQNGFFSVRPTN